MRRFFVIVYLRVALPCTSPTTRNDDTGKATKWSLSADQYWWGIESLLNFSPNTRRALTHMLLAANSANRKWCKNPENDRNPAKWVLIWEYSARAIKWIPRWQGLDDFQKSLHPCALDESSLSIGRVNAHSSQKQPANCNDILQARAKSGKYLMGKYQAEHYLQLFFKYFAKPFPIPKLLSKVS